ncbi:MAG: NrdH-redoxin [bacterium]|nr:NrdH-redoxin [bacterium]
MKIKFYGATWCPDCRRSKQFLDDNNADYEYINLDENPDAADEVVRINNGYQSIPTIVFPDGKVLVEPSNEELKQAMSDMEDCIICHKTDKKSS